MNQKITGGLTIIFIVGFISFLLFSIARNFELKEKKISSEKKTADSIEVNKMIDSVTRDRIEKGD